MAIDPVIAVSALPIVPSCSFDMDFLTSAVHISIKVVDRPRCLPLLQSVLSHNRRAGNMTRRKLTYYEYPSSSSMCSLFYPRFRETGTRGCACVSSKLECYLYLKSILDFPVQLQRDFSLHSDSIRVLNALLCFCLPKTESI